MARGRGVQEWDHTNCKTSGQKTCETLGLWHRGRRKAAHIRVHAQQKPWHLHIWFVPCTIFLLLCRYLGLSIWDEEKGSQLNWETRHNIIHGIAGGLLYLREDSRLKIIHRDLKPNNVLLDHDMVLLLEIISGKETVASTSHSLLRHS